MLHTYDKLSKKEYETLFLYGRCPRMFKKICFQLRNGKLKPSNIIEPQKRIETQLLQIFLVPTIVDFQKLSHLRQNF